MRLPGRPRPGALTLWPAAALTAVLAATLAGCASPASTAGGRTAGVPAPSSPTWASSGMPSPVASATDNPDVSVSAMAASARLDPCPTSSSTAPARPDGLPDVVLACLGPDGTRSVRLAGLRGPVVLNIWGSWCVPCRQEAPLFQRLHAAAGGRLVVLGVDFADATPLALAFAASEDLHYPSVVAAATQFPLRRWAAGLPVTLLVDARGSIVDVQRGPFTSWQQLRDIVAARLGVSL